MPYAREEGRVVIAYSPLGQGLLSGRYGLEHKPGGWYRSRTLLFRDRTIRRALPLITAVGEIAKGHGATPAQVALAWLIGHENVVAIPGASSTTQLEENVAAAELELTASEREQLTAEAALFELAVRR